MSLHLEMGGLLMGVPLHKSGRWHHDTYGAEVIVFNMDDPAGEESVHLETRQDLEDLIAMLESLRDRVGRE